MSRLAAGKKDLEEQDISLPDKLYVKIALSYVGKRDKFALTEYVGTAQQRRRSTKQKLVRKLFDLPFDRLKALVKANLPSGAEYKLNVPARIAKQMVFTEEQAKKFFKLASGTQEPAQPKRKRNGSTDGGAKPTCYKCKNAGLKGRSIAHRAEDCDDDRRKKNVRKMKEKKQKSSGEANPTKRQRSEGNTQAPPKNKKSQDVCNICKTAGRKHSHKQSKCKFAPGGPWHGKTTEEVKELQKQYYKELNEERAKRAETNQIVQLRKRRKLCRSELSGELSQENSEVAVWAKETTLMAAQKDSTHFCEIASDSEESDPTDAPQLQFSEIQAATPGVSEDSETEDEFPIGSESPLRVTTPECTPGYAGDSEAEAEDDSQSEDSDDEAVPRVTGELKPEATPLKKIASTNMDAGRTETSTAKVAPEAAAKAANSVEKDADTGKPDVEIEDLSDTDGSSWSPMTTEEFLQKRDELRRNEWTKAKVRSAELPAEREDEEDAEPVVFVGPTFECPPLGAMMSAADFVKTLHTMARNGAKVTPQKDMSAVMRSMMPVCYMMHEVPEASQKQARSQTRSYRFHRLSTCQRTSRTMP